jgi:hypothetical protein
MNKILRDKIATLYPYNILKYDYLNDDILILFESPMKSNFNENLILFSSNGNLLWAIEKVEHPYEDSPYDGFDIFDNQIYGYNYDGHMYIINIKTGNILSKTFKK